MIDTLPSHRDRDPASEADLQTPLGRIRLHWRGETLIGVDLEPMDDPMPDGAEAIPPRIQACFTAYFVTHETCFDIPIALAGTPFQRRVWDALHAIPPGETRTYGEIARALGSGARAVGQACRANPCPIAIPCHRVVATQGLGGFSGDVTGRKLGIKRWLLRHEGSERPEWVQGDAT